MVSHSSWDEVRTRVKEFHCASSVFVPIARDFVWDPGSGQVVFLGSILVDRPESDGFLPKPAVKLLTLFSTTSVQQHTTELTDADLSCDISDHASDSNSNSTSNSTESSGYWEDLRMRGMDLDLRDIRSEQNAECLSTTEQNPSQSINCLPIIDSSWFQHHSSKQAESLSTEEVLLKERKRMTTQGITAFHLHRRVDGLCLIVFPFEQSLYWGMTDLGQRAVFTPTAIPSAHHNPRMDPKLGGKNMDLISFVRHKDLWVTSLSGQELQLTHSGSETLSNGASEFIMQEEFRRFTGYWWAPPSCPSKEETILFMEVDESMVEVIYIARSGLDESVDKYRYPRPGKPNAKSEPCIVSFDSSLLSGSTAVVRRLHGRHRISAMFPWAEYIVRAGWLPHGRSIWLQVLDRPQKRSVLLHVPISLFMTAEEYASRMPSNTQSRISVLCEDTFSYWVNVTDIVHFSRKCDENLVEFIWASERTGFRHLYLFSCSLDSRSSSVSQPYHTPKRRIRQITSGSWQVVDNTIWVDEDLLLVYFISKKETPLENHLYVCSYAPSQTIEVDPSAWIAPGGAFSPSDHQDRSFLLTTPGFSHIIKMDPTCRFFVATSSSIHSRPRCFLYYLLFESNQNQLSPTLGPTTPFTITINSGVPPIPGSSSSSSRQSQLQQQRVHHMNRSSTARHARLKTSPTREVYLRKRSQSRERFKHDKTVRTKHSSVECSTSTSEFERFGVSSGAVSGRCSHPVSLVIGAFDWKENLMSSASFVVPEPEIFSFYNSDGIEIFGMIYKPPNFQSDKKYPVLLRIYGGPNVQVITNDYKYPKSIRVFLALSFGYIVVMIDSRGSYDRGLEFEGHIKNRLGSVELNDQLEGLIYLVSHEGRLATGSRDQPIPGRIKGSDAPDWNVRDAWKKILEDCEQGKLNSFIDPFNISITGWSYGGYLSLMALVKFPDVFRVAIAGAPVTCWELYDTAYTERYLGLVEENPGGYRQGSILEVINKFPDHENRVLIVHGSIDENVHFRNTEMVVSALVRASKPHRVQVYPGERHGLRAANVVEHFETLMMWTLLNSPPLPNNKL